ncbi:hypothetical protein EWB00_011362, partial [Schistosoma japonicum]
DSSIRAASFNETHVLNTNPVADFNNTNLVDSPRLTSSGPIVVGVQFTRLVLSHHLFILLHPSKELNKSFKCEYFINLEI